MLMLRSAVAALLLASVLVLTGCSSAGRVPAEEAAEAWYNLGNAYTDLGRNTDAVNAYIKARGLNPDLLSAGFNLARVYIILEKYEESLEQLEMLLDSDPANRTVLETKAWVYHLTGDDDSALKIYNAILNDFQGSRNSLYNSALILAEKQDAGEALRRFRIIAELYPDEASVVFEIARIEASLGNPEEALIWLDKRLAAVPDDSAALELSGDMYANRKLYAEAVTEYRKLTDLPELDRETAGRGFFKTGEILLLYMEDSDGGLEALKSCVETGWRSSDDFDRLLSYTDADWYERASAILINEAESAGTEDSVPASE